MYEGSTGPEGTSVSPKVTSGNHIRQCYIYFSCSCVSCWVAGSLRASGDQVGGKEVSGAGQRELSASFTVCKLSLSCALGSFQVSYFVAVTEELRRI